MCAGAGEQGFSLTRMHGFHHVSVQGHRSFFGIVRVGKGLDYPCGPVDIARAGAENGVRRPDLAGMDEALAIKTQSPSRFSFTLKPVGIAIGVINPVDDMKTGRTRLQDQPGQMRLASRPSRVLGQAQTRRQIIHSGHEQSDAQLRRDHAVSIKANHRKRGFNHRPDGKGEAGLIQRCSNGVKGVGLIDLGDKDGIGRAGAHSAKVCGQFRTARLGDADDSARPVCSEVGNGGRCGLPRARFGAGSDGVLKVKDQRIRAQSGRFFNRAGLVTGYE